MALSPKVARKQAELALPLIRQLEKTVTEGRPADWALRCHYRAHPEFGSRDRRFFSALAFAWFRWRGWLTPLSDTHCAMAYLLDAIEPHPTAILMAGQDGFNRLDPTPAGGRSVEEKAALVGHWLGIPEPAVEKLAPDWLAAQLYVPGNQEPEAHLRQCIKAFQNRPPTWIRAEPGALDQVCAALARQTIPARPHPLIANAIRLQGSHDLERLSTEASFEIQDIASQCVGLICAPARGEKWWDVCAGAGGKSLHLADLMDGAGSILATDVRAGSLDGLRRRAARRNVRSIECRVRDGTRDPAPGRLFDGVLIDAPCSGLGTWARNPDARWRTTENDIAQRSGQDRIQQKLLAAGADKVRPGGRLVYAVCTMTIAETTAVIAGFLEARPDFRLEPTPHPLTARPTAGQVWIWPWEADCNGMFVARMNRIR